MITRKLSAGDTIEAICTRCRKVLNHTIVAMVGDRVARVECNTCRGTHNYHGEREQKAKAAGKTGAVTPRKVDAAPRKGKKDQGEVDREEWESLRPTMAIDKAVPYNMTGRYQANSIIDHSVFGLGIVKLVIKPNKIEVLFQDGKKLLRYNAI